MTEVIATLRAPFPHQQRAVEQLKLWGGSGLLADEMGLGKSSTALWVMRDLNVYPLVIVCPLSVVHKWAKEVEDTIGWSVSVLSRNPTKHTTDEMRRVRIVHYDRLLGIDKGQALAMLSSFGAEGRTGLILDESHYAKNRLAKRSRGCAYLAANADHVLCLTGTPVRNDVRDLWHQVELTHPGHLGTYAHFEARYTKQTLLRLPQMRRPVRKFDGTRNEAELSAKLHDVMVMRKKKDVFDLPPKIRTVVELDMGKEERERYDEMKRSAMVTLEALRNTPAPVTGDGGWADVREKVNVIARTALEQVIRLEQLTCGVLGGSSLDQPATFADAAKIQWTLETIEDLRTQGRSCVVFCKFNATIEMLSKLLPKTAHHDFALTGNTPSADRANILEMFRSSSSQVLLCQLKLAEGFDLTPLAHKPSAGCTDAIFLGIDWTPAAMDQAEDRLHRIGTTGTVNCYYPVIRKSIDKRLYRVVMEKREDAHRVLSPSEVMEELR